MKRIIITESSKNKSLLLVTFPLTLTGSVLFTGMVGREGRSITFWNLNFHIYGIKFKACIRYFLSKFYFSPNDSPSKTMKNLFYFMEKALFVLEIFKFLYIRLPLFSSLSAIALDVDSSKILKFIWRHQLSK